MPASLHALACACRVHGRLLGERRGRVRALLRLSGAGRVRRRGHVDADRDHRGRARGSRMPHRVRTPRHARGPRRPNPQASRDKPAAHCDVSSGQRRASTGCESQSGFAARSKRRGTTGCTNIACFGWGKRKAQPAQGTRAEPRTPSGRAGVLRPPFPFPQGRTEVAGPACPRHLPTGRGPESLPERGRAASVVSPDARPTSLQDS